MSKEWLRRRIYWRGPRFVAPDSKGWLPTLTLGGPRGCAVLSQPGNMIATIAREHADRATWRSVRNLSPADYSKLVENKSPASSISPHAPQPGTSLRIVQRSYQPELAIQRLLPRGLVARARRPSATLWPRQINSFRQRLAGELPRPPGALRDSAWSWTTC